MSRKSRGKKHKAEASPEVVEAAPESEVLAEGSGPVSGAEGVVVHVGIDVIAGADVDELASAASTVGLEAVARHADAPAMEAETDASEPADSVDPIDPVVDPEPAGDPVVASPEALEEIPDDEAEELGATLPTSAASMDPQMLKHLVESLVFASDKPITIQRLRQLTRVSDVRRLEQALVDLAADYSDRGIVLQQVSGGYQFRTRTQFSTWVQQLIAGRPVRLSRAQLETLAIVAYRQPITRPEIDEIRGVDSSATLKLLLDRSLIRILGKREEVGRPMLYGTTKEFLDFFSLGDLRELPTLREYSELTDESRRVMTDRLGIDPDAPDEPEDSEVIEAPEPSLDEMIASYTQSIDEAATTGVYSTADSTIDSTIAAALDEAADAEAADMRDMRDRQGVPGRQGMQDMQDMQEMQDIEGELAAGSMASMPVADVDPDNLDPGTLDPGNLDPDNLDPVDPDTVDPDDIDVPTNLRAGGQPTADDEVMSASEADAEEPPTVERPVMSLDALASRRLSSKPNIDVDVQIDATTADDDGEPSEPESSTTE